jgi:hypothetical protein
MAPVSISPGLHCIITNNRALVFEASDHSSTITHLNLVARELFITHTYKVLDTSSYFKITFKELFGSLPLISLRGAAYCSPDIFISNSKRTDNALPLAAQLDPWEKQRLTCLIRNIS